MYNTGYNPILPQFNSNLLAMTERSESFWLVALFLSKFTDNVDGKDVPPMELTTVKWKDAYRSFYETLGHGRTLNSFELSLRNARDTFDSHIPESPRVGWRYKDGDPERMISVAAKIFSAILLLREVMSGIKLRNLQI